MLRVSGLLLYFLLVYHTESKLKEVFCPSYCKCDIYLRYRRATCQNKRIVSAEIGVPPEVQFLDVSFNHISELPEKVFFETGLTNLKLLNLSHNKLSQIHMFGFEGLRNLKSLDLSYNIIQYFIEQWFRDLADLRELYLRGNDLDLINKQPALQLPKLQILDLADCRIEYLSDNLFTGLPSLKILDISHNYFQHLKVEVIIPLQNLQTLIAADNTLYCHDNSMTLLTEYIRQKGIEYIGPCRKLQRLQISSTAETKVSGSKDDIDDTVMDVENFNGKDNMSNGTIKVSDKLILGTGPTDAIYSDSINQNSSGSYIQNFNETDVELSSSNETDINVESSVGTKKSTVLDVSNPTKHSIAINNSDYSNKIDEESMEVPHNDLNNNINNDESLNKNKELGDDEYLDVLKKYINSPQFQKLRKEAEAEIMANNTNEQASSTKSTLSNETENMNSWLIEEKQENIENAIEQLAMCENVTNNDNYNELDKFVVKLIIGIKSPFWYTVCTVLTGAVFGATITLLFSSKLLKKPTTMKAENGDVTEEIKPKIDSLLEKGLQKFRGGSPKDSGKAKKSKDPTEIVYLLDDELDAANSTPVLPKKALDKKDLLPGSKELTLSEMGLEKEGPPKDSAKTEKIKDPAEVVYLLDDELNVANNTPEEPTDSKVYLDGNIVEK